MGDESCRSICLARTRRALDDEVRLLELVEHETLLVEVETLERATVERGLAS